MCKRSCESQLANPYELHDEIIKEAALGQRVKTAVELPQSHWLPSLCRQCEQLDFGWHNFESFSFGELFISSSSNWLNTALDEALSI